MSPTIRIDEEVFDALKAQAEPFVDTPNSVLRRVLGLSEVDEAADDVEPRDDTRPSPGESSRSNGRRRRRRSKSARRGPRAKTGSILSEDAYEIPMLQIISEHGDRAAAREVLDELETRLDGLLTEVDKQPLATGTVRWRNRAQFVRLRLIERGDLVKDSPRGMWEITEQGRRRLADAA